MSEDARTVSKIAGTREFQWVWGSLLVGATIVLTGRYACAVPFAALAALAALTSGRRSALILIGAIWFANQAVGFAFLNYPVEFQCIGWGLMLGTSAVLSLLAARFAVAVLRDSGIFLRAGLAFVFAFGAYEGSLCVATFAASSSEAASAPPVIAEIAVINTAAFAVLFCTYRALLAAGLLGQSLLSASSIDFRGAKPRTA